jgi:uncharacterized protein YjbJ (UPF0337 family)
VVGKVVGKAKEALGGATANDELAREGRLQQAQSETEQANRLERDASAAERRAEQLDPNEENR